MRVWRPGYAYSRVGETQKPCPRGERGQPGLHTLKYERTIIKFQQREGRGKKTEARVALEKKKSFDVQAPQMEKSFVTRKKKYPYR